MVLNISNVAVDSLKNEMFEEKQVTVFVARLDKIHPIVSGNKLFKLYYFLQEAGQSDRKTILTFGGAYSNHLVATAFACADAGLKSIGIVRGEQPGKLSHTLTHCLDYGMQLKFISRDEFSKKDSTAFNENLTDEFGNCTMIPEGGYHPTGARGAALIMDILRPFSFTHICTAMGTATTAAGLLAGTNESQEIVIVPVLKGMKDINERLLFLTENKGNISRTRILDEYHFGGYAKYNSTLIDFMNTIYKQYLLPTDFVYTGKMLFAIFDAIKKNVFPKGSKIVCLHTGGLQGNGSLPSGTLIF